MEHLPEQIRKQVCECHWDGFVAEKKRDRDGEQVQAVSDVVGL